MSQAARRRPLVRSGWIVLLVIAAGCELETRQSGSRSDSGAAKPHAASAAALPDRFMLGTPASAAHLAAIDIDANPSGVGLSPGQGTYTEGKALYAQRCAMCHGPKGEGIAAFPPLVSAAADTSFAFGNDVRLVKTIGNYWPHATTLYDYIHRAMPFDAPGTLSPNQVYGLVAYLLAENGIVDRSVVMNARTLRAVRMPASGRFVPDDRAGSDRVR